MPTLVFASWAITESMVQGTSGEEFCGGCHTMTPMVQSYRQDVHGGAGEAGVQAKCTQCHVPHNSTVGYMVAKSRFGIHDAWAQLTYDLDAIDWHAMRTRSEEYVFDSGCVKCHSNLQSATEGNAVSYVAHRPYFLGTVESKCVTCHSNVGHKDLGNHLPTVNKETP